MRFSISLLTLICIASVIGTVLKQQEPLANYVNQFGPFWAAVFDALHLYAVYSAWWFLLILAFLVLSTSLCVARSTPKILRDWRLFKADMREGSLRAFGLHSQALLPQAPAQEAQRITHSLRQAGWRVRVAERAAGAGMGWMVAAKAGAANKLGYIAAHSAIVLVCLGGLLDGDLVVRAQMLWQGKSLYSGGGLVADVAPQHRLGVGNPTFRGNLLVAEGARSGTAILSQPGGVLLQELPFEIELKKFSVEHYSTGMPKLFASDIVIHDKQTGAQQAARVEVNHPAHYRGVEIYQSSFDDGGSTVRLKALPLRMPATPKTAAFEVQGVIGGSSQLAQGTETLTLEYTALRVMNVENLGHAEASGADVRKVDLRAALQSRLGAANKADAPKDLRNVGPSITYKLRDAAGQAREFHNYMLPVDLGDGVPVFLLGSRETPADAFRYLRIPADEQGRLDGFLALRAALAEPRWRAQAVQRYVARAVDVSKPELVQQLSLSASRALALFAGDTVAGKPPRGGLQAVSDFIETGVPQAERERASEVVLRILNGALWELAQLAREQAGLPAMKQDAAADRFMAQALLALSDCFFYPAPLSFELTGFDQVQASVFQVARAPGKRIVYAGCALLILGVFAMLYVRERRLWVWLKPQGDGSAALMAMSHSRKTLDGPKEFEVLKSQLIGTSP